MSQRLGPSIRRNLLVARQTLGLEWDFDTLLRMSHLAPELPPGRARVVLALLVSGPQFEPPERPVTYSIVANALGIAVSTVREHLRRLRAHEPRLYAEVMAVRAARYERWHAAVALERAERSRLWGKRRWAARYRCEHGTWPWLDVRHVGQIGRAR